MPDRECTGPQYSARVSTLEAMTIPFFPRFECQNQQNAAVV